MSLGKLKAKVKLLHIGVLRQFGFADVILDADGDRLAPSEVEIVSEEMLNHPDIQACISGGVLEHILDGQEPTSEEMIEPTPVILAEETQPIENLEETQEPEGPSTNEETQPETPAEELQEPEVVEDGADTEENLEDGVLSENQLKRFDEINSMKAADAKEEIETMEDPELLSKLFKSAKISSVQKAAQKKLEELLGN